MNIQDVTNALLEALDASRCEYMLVGAIAAVHYGVTRSTFDVDVVVRYGTEQPAQLAALLGPSFRLEPQQGFEAIYPIGTPFRISLFPVLDDLFDLRRFTRRRQVKIGTRNVCLPTAEDVVVQKLRAGRNKDLDDARDVIAVQLDALDWAYIEGWCYSHGTFMVLQQLRALIPAN